MSTAKFDTWKDAAGTNEFYKCRAWVNFNGTGTVAIRASGNVTSITDNGTGNYTVNFTNAMPDADYAVIGTNGYAANTTNIFSIYNSAAVPTASGFRVSTNIVGSGVDPEYVLVTVFR